MSIYLMLAIAVLAGFVGTGFVWFGWNAVENIVAMRSAPADGTDEDAAPESAEA
jgi:hypothetical protein